VGQELKERMTYNSALIAKVKVILLNLSKLPLVSFSNTKKHAGIVVEKEPAEHLPAVSAMLTNW
jgi:hypothetical protein